MYSCPIRYFQSLIYKSLIREVWSKWCSYLINVVISWSEELVENYLVFIFLLSWRYLSRKNTDVIINLSFMVSSRIPASDQATLVPA